MSAAEHRRGPLLPVAELAVAAMTAAAVAGHARLFLDDDWLRPLLVTVVLSHAVMVAMRRLGRGLLLTAAAAIVVMVGQITWVHYRPTARGVLPTTATRDAIDADLTAAWNLFGEVKAPTETTVGFLVLATVVIWLIAYLADWAAFRLWSALEAILPALGAVVFIAFFGEDENRLALTTLYLAAVASFLLAHRLVRESHRTRWLADSGRTGTAALARAGTVMIVLVVVAGAALGPALPGADQSALVDLDPGDSGPGPRVVVSPIVDIRGRLVEQADIEVFTVRSEIPSYWRLASLDEFNGTVWGADASYRDVSGPLPDDFPSSAAVVTVEQTFDVTNLGAVWIPAAFEPRAVSTDAVDAISYEEVSGTLIVSRDLSSSDGLAYTVTSEIPTFDPAALAAAPAEYPADIAERYLALPDDFSPTATTLATEITAGATNDYERALALQNWFRDNFVYDLTVGAGHSNDRIETFLASGRGYCEQFAGSFAAMARSIGMPARVAVGFTWGDQDPADPTLWRVRGEHAHAWPEVFIAGSGWVAFEPTPSRGAPGAQAWTNVAPAQEGTSPEEAPVPTPTVAPDAVPDVEAPFPTDLAPTVPAPGTGGGAAEDDRSGGLGPVGVAVLVSLLVTALYVAVVVGGKEWRIRRARDVADNRRRISAAWAEAVDHLGPMGLRRNDTETVTEFAGRTAARTGDAAADLRGLATLTVEAVHGPSEPSDSAVERARAHRDRLVAAAREITTPAQRLRRLLDPRPLLKRRQP